MSVAIPLIRSAALAPCVRWMRASGRDVAAWLRDGGLGPLALDDPLRPIPLRSAATLLRDLGRAEGPDIGCRVIRPASLRDLVGLGDVLLAARTPREAITRAGALLHCHCTHEHILVSDRMQIAEVRETWSLAFDDETLHMVQSYVAAIVRAICALTDVAEPLLLRVEVVPHPEFGREHLRPWFGAALAGSAARSLRLLIDAHVADRPFRREFRDRQVGRPERWHSLRCDSFAGSVRRVVGAMIGHENVSLDSVAALAGLSRRTLQRRLAEDGTSFSALVEESRREEALWAIGGGSRPLGEIAACLGYSGQSTLTRAVHRWTGLSPTELRQHGLDDALSARGIEKLAREAK